MKWYGSRFLLKKAFKINSPVLREPLANNQIFIKKLICYEISGEDISSYINILGCLFILRGCFFFFFNPNVYLFVIAVIFLEN